MFTCPHCNRPFTTRKGRTIHARRCPDIPGMRQRILKLNARHCPHPGQLLPSPAYDDLVQFQAPDLPTSSILVGHCGPGWPDVAAWLDLQPWTPHSLDAVLHRLREISHQLHNSEIGPSISEWDLWAGDEYPTHTWCLRHIAPHWPDVLAAAGLQDVSRGQRMVIARRRRQQLLNALDDPEIPRTADLRPTDRLPRPLPTVHGWQPKTVYDWRRRQPVTCLVAELR